jgi:hypothetical protein
LSLEPTSTSEQPVARIGQTLPISAILPQMLETEERSSSPSQRVQGFIKKKNFASIAMELRRLGITA